MAQLLQRGTCPFFTTRQLSACGVGGEFDIALVCAGTKVHMRQCFLSGFVGNSWEGTLSSKFLFPLWASALSCCIDQTNTFYDCVTVTCLHHTAGPSLHFHPSLEIDRRLMKVHVPEASFREWQLLSHFMSRLADCCF